MPMKMRSRIISSFRMSYSQYFAKQNSEVITLSTLSPSWYERLLNLSRSNIALHCGELQSVHKTWFLPHHSPFFLRLSIRSLSLYHLLRPPVHKSMLLLAWLSPFRLTQMWPGTFHIYEIISSIHDVTRFILNCSSQPFTGSLLSRSSRYVLSGEVIARR